MNKFLVYCTLGLLSLLTAVGSVQASTTMVGIKDTPATSVVAQSGSHVFTFTPTFTNVKHIKIEFHTTNPLNYDPVSTTDLPVLAGATFAFSSSSLWTDAGGIQANISTTVSGNSILLSRIDGGGYILPTTLRTITINNLTNPTQTGTLYFTVSTYTTDGQLSGGLASSVEQGTGALSTTDSIQVTGFIGTTFYFGVDDSNTSTASNTTDTISSSDASVRANLSFGTLQSSAMPLELSTTGFGKDGNKLMISTNSPRGYVITLEDTPSGLSLPGMTASDRALASSGNGVIKDFGQEVLDGSVSGSSFSALQTAILSGLETFTFTLVSGPSPSLAVGTYFSLKNSHTSPAKIAEFLSATPTEHVYMLDYSATKNVNTPGGTYTDTLTYTALPAL